jgi:hypothetical protein
MSFVKKYIMHTSLLIFLVTFCITEAGVGGKSIQDPIPLLNSLLETENPLGREFRCIQEPNFDINIELKEEKTVLDLAIARKENAGNALKIAQKANPTVDYTELPEGLEYWHATQVLNFLEKKTAAKTWAEASKPGRIQATWRKVHQPSFARIDQLTRGEPVDLVAIINDAIAEVNSLDYFLAQQFPDLALHQPREEKLGRKGATIDWCSCPSAPMEMRYQLAIGLALWCKDNLPAEERLHHIEFGAGHLKQMVIFSHSLMALGIRKATFYAIDDAYKPSAEYPIKREYLQAAWDMLYRDKGVDFKIEFNVYPPEKTAQTLSACDISDFPAYPVLNALKDKHLAVRLFSGAFKKFKFTTITDVSGLRDFESLREERLDAETTGYFKASKNTGITDTDLRITIQPKSEDDNQLHTFAASATSTTSQEDCDMQIRLAQDAGIDINAPNSNGYAPLDLALLSRNGFNNNVITALINAGAVRYNSSLPQTKTVSAGAGRDALSDLINYLEYLENHLNTVHDLSHKPNEISSTTMKRASDPEDEWRPDRKIKKGVAGLWQMINDLPSGLKRSFATRLVKAIVGTMRANYIAALLKPEYLAMFNPDENIFEFILGSQPCKTSFTFETNREIYSTCISSVIDQVKKLSDDLKESMLSRGFYALIKAESNEYLKKYINDEVDRKSFFRNMGRMFGKLVTTINLDDLRLRYPDSDVLEGLRRSQSAAAEPMGAVSDLPNDIAARATSSHTSGAGSGSGSASATWACSVCTFENIKLDAPVCEMCQSVR